VIVQPETVVRWHREVSAYIGAGSLAHAGSPGSPTRLRDLIREMSLANPLWGAPRIHGELLKLGIEVAQSTVAKSSGDVGDREPELEDLSAQPCRRLAAMDLARGATIGFRLLYVLVISAITTADPVVRCHLSSDSGVDRRQITDAFPWTEAPRYLIRDR